PVERMLLIGADQTANRWTVRAEMGLAGLAGRNAELTTLTRALASRDRVGVALVQVTGPAGIGKSRLIHEFLASDEVRLCQVVKFVGDPHRKYSAYHPVSTWLRALLDIRNSDTVPEARHKLGRMVAQLEGVSEDERQSLET